MNLGIKRVLIICAKNAVFAFLTNSALMLQWHSIFNFHNLPGVWAVTRATLSVIGAREGLIWIPIIMKWSQTGADGTDLQQALQHAAQANQQTVAAAKEVGEALAEAKAEVPKQSI